MQEISKLSEEYNKILIENTMYKEKLQNFNHLADENEVQK